MNSDLNPLNHTFHGRRIPLKNAGIHIGNTTASFRSFFASTKSAMSSLRKHVRLLSSSREEIPALDLVE